MERTKVSPELYRAFEEYFPQTESLVKEIQESYNAALNKQNPCKLKSNFRLIGDISYDAPFLPMDKNIPPTPALRFCKKAERANPPFYLITSPKGEVLYIGTSEKTGDDTILSQSVSAITGGIFPITETKQAYTVYLGLLSMVKQYGICYVYEIPTGYENIKMNVDKFTKDVKVAAAKIIYKNILNSYKDEYGCLPVVNCGVPLFGSIHNIWKCVSAFKTMVENGLVEVEEKDEKKIFDDDDKFFALNRMKDNKELSGFFDKAKELMDDKKFWKQVEAAKLLNELDEKKIRKFFETITDRDEVLFVNMPTDEPKK